MHMINDNSIPQPSLETELYDIAIIGSGPGGYHAALRAASYGARVAMIEKEERLGGTCSNWGCIPTKALYSSAKIIEDIQEKANAFGIQIPSYTLNFQNAVERKNQVVRELTEGIATLCKAKKVRIFKGFGSLEGGDIYRNFELNVRSGENNLKIRAKRVIIATGSMPSSFPQFNVDHKKILDSNDVLHPNFKTLPKSVIIIGGGVIGCEFASIFAHFGSKVIILEYLDSILANEEKSIVRILKEKFNKLNIEIHESINVLKVDYVETGIRATTIPANIPKDQIDSAPKTSFDAELCLVAVGRKKFIEGLGLDKFNIALERGAIRINHITMETTHPGIYAIGDCTGILMLAHFASYQGDIAILNALSSIGTFEDVHPEGANFTTVPATTFTVPTIGSVGLREKEAKEKYGEILVGRFAYASSGKAKCMGEDKDNAFMMVIADKKTDKIVGASCVGEAAAELISEISVAMRLGLTTEEMARVIHSHPTLSEIALEAIEDVHGMAIHKAGKRR